MTDIINFPVYDIICRIYYMYGRLLPQALQPEEEKSSDGAHTVSRKSSTRHVSFSIKHDCFANRSLTGIINQKFKELGYPDQIEKNL